MTTPSDRPYAEPQDLTSEELVVYEAIATLEQSGRPPTQAEIAAAAGLDGETVATTLRGLVGRKVAVAAGGPAGAGATGQGYTLARHDWSSVPDIPARGQPPVPEAGPVPPPGQ